MAELDLLAILSVDRNKRIRCQAEGCGRSVYKAIHVCKMDGKIVLYGSECFKQLSGYHEPKPSYGSWGGSVLTNEQRQALLDNTEALLQELKVKYERETKKEETPKPKPVEAMPPVQRAPRKPTNLEYDAERNLMCMSCWTSFRSKIRHCPACGNTDRVVTQAID